MSGGASSTRASPLLASVDLPVPDEPLDVAAWETLCQPPPAPRRETALDRALGFAATDERAEPLRIGGRRVRAPRPGTTRRALARALAILLLVATIGVVAFLWSRQLSPYLG
ncbi:MAG TPA: hypothetical protein VGQ83_19520 [Polyangia bacterium]|jgi:hypothetical protein